MLVEEPDKLESGGARVYEQGVAVADEFNGALRDGLLGGDIDVDAAILGGYGQSLLERHSAAMRAAQLAGLGERV